MNPIKEYLPYYRGLIKRSKEIGFLSMLKEYSSYYNKYAKLPAKLGFKADNNYRLFVLYNYIKITYFLWDESTEYIMKFVPRRMQKFLLPKINPLNQKYNVVDKTEFYRLAQKHGYPIPKTYFYTKDGKIYTLEGNELSKNDINYLEGKLIFSKIADGSAAVGAKKEIFSTSNLNLTEYRIFQEALNTHQDILGLSPTKALNCIKISSYLTNNEEVKIQLSFIKLGDENSIVDNIGGEAGGGIAIPIDLETGILKEVGYKEVGKDLRVSTIPSSGKHFKGFIVPFF